MVLVKPAAIENIRHEIQRLLADASCSGSDTATMRDGPTRSNVSRHRVTASGRARLTRTRVFSRYTTTTPPTLPPILLCPLCDRPLTYERSHIGGVSDRHPEQWDEYGCSNACGTFQYRHRTRKLRQSDDAPLKRAIEG